VAVDPPGCRIADGVRTELELSPTFRGCRERYASIESRLAGERAVRAAPAAAAS
jgi:hypothetical protein